MREPPLASPAEIVTDGIRTKFRELYPSARFVVREPNENSDELIIETLVGNHSAGVSFTRMTLKQDPTDYLITLGVDLLKLHIEKQVA